MANVTQTIVLKVSGKEVEHSFNGLRREASKLSKEIKKLTPGTEKFSKKAAELEEAKIKFQEVKDEINQVNGTLNKSSEEFGGFADLFSKLGGRFEGTLINMANVGNLSFKSLGGGIKVFAAESWAAISSIPIVGWIAGVVAAIGLGVKEIWDFNNALFEANKLTQQITQLQGDALDKATIRSQALEKVLGIDRKDILRTAKNIVQNYSVTYSQAMDEIERGAIKGGSANSEFLDSLREYPVFMKKAGYSLSEFVNIVNAGFDLGVYSDKLPDAIKEFDLSMREQTTATKKALTNAFGVAFSTDLLNRVNNGKTTVKDALVELSKESQKYQLTEKQQAQLTADIFRGAGEDVGGFAKIMDVVTDATDRQTEALTEHQQLVKEQIENYNEVGEAKLKALKTDAFFAWKRDLENIWSDIKVGWYRFIAGLRTQMIFIGSVFTTIFDLSKELPSTISTAFVVLKKDLNELGDSMKYVGKMIKSALTLDIDGLEKNFSQLKDSLKNSFSNTKKVFSSAGTSAGEIFMENLDNAIAKDKAKVEAQKILDQQRAGNENKKPRNNFDFPKNKSKNNDKNKAKQRQKELDEIAKAEEEAYQKRMAVLFEYEEKRAKAIEDGFKRENELESNRRNKEEFKNKTDISVLEKQIQNSSSENEKTDLKKQLDILNQIEILNEESHQRKMLSIQQKYDAIAFHAEMDAKNKILEENRRLAEEKIQSITTMEDAKLALSKMKYLKLTRQELSAVRSLEDAKRALRENANRSMLAAQLKFLEAQKKQLEDVLTRMTGEEAEKLKANLDELTKRILFVKGAIQGGNENDDKKVTEERKQELSEVDFLGFSADQWGEMFDNLDTTKGKVAAISMVFKALSNATQMFANLQRAIGKRELKAFEKQQSKKKKTLLKRLNEGYINQEQYQKEIQKIEAETANKKAEIEYKQAKAEKIGRMFSILGDTAAAVAKALPNVPLAIAVGALGAIQFGIAASQPLPEKPSFAKGGYTGPGIGPPDSSGYRPAGLVHEKEYVTPEWMMQNPIIADVVGWMESIRIGRISLPKSYAEGGAVSGDVKMENIEFKTDDNSNTHQFMNILHDVQELLIYLKENGVEAYMVENAENGKKIQRAIKQFQKIENRNARTSA